MSNLFFILMPYLNKALKNISLIFLSGFQRIAFWNINVQIKIRRILAEDSGTGQHKPLTWLAAGSTVRAVVINN